jgi:hypothetical protein
MQVHAHKKGEKEFIILKKQVVQFAEKQVFHHAALLFTANIINSTNKVHTVCISH